jgi:hypothetical protein
LQTARHLLTGTAATAYRFARSAAARPGSRLAAFALLALAVTWPLLSTAGAMNEFRDAHVLAHYETVARDTILRWHQAPLWDPYYCGGLYLLGTPQARFASPTFLLTLAFGEPRAEALTAFAMIVVGLEGAFRYSRARRATSFASFVTAPVFALSGVFALAPALGWVSFFGFELLPWIALGFRRSLARDLGGAVLAATALAFCIGFGGTYTAPLAVIWCALEFVEAAVRRRRSWGDLALGCGVAACAALLSGGVAAVRLWPVAETLLAAPRIIGGTPGNSWAAIARQLVLPTASDTENGAFFVGWVIAPAVVLGLARRRALAMAIAAFVCGWLAAGYAVRPSLFAALHELPVYSVLRYPERFLVLAALAIGSIAAQGVTFAEALARPRASHAQANDRHPRRGRSRARVLLALVVAAALANVGPEVAIHWNRAAGRWLAAPPEAASAPFRQARGNRWALGYYEPMQRGSLSCWEAYPVPQSPLLRGDAPSEERVVDVGAGRVTERSWSPNAIDMQVELSRPATVAVNQNWHPGWRSSVGQVRSEGGLLAVELGPGTHDVELRFAPRSATGGAAASLVALVMAIVLARRSRHGWRVVDRRGLGRVALLSAAPVMPALLAWGLMRAPSAGGAPGAGASPDLLTPDGRPLIADELDEGVVRLDAKLEGDVVLEGATLSNPDPPAGSDVTLELDWRRGAHVPTGVGVFVHLEPSSGDAMNGDHALLSAVLDLEDAPVGKTLRDVIPIHLPDDARGKRWKVWAGLWLLRRGGGRVRVVDEGHAIVEGDRVLVAQFVAR